MSGETSDRWGMDRTHHVLIEEEKKGQIAFCFCHHERNILPVFSLYPPTAAHLWHKEFQVSQGLNHNNTSRSTLSTYTAPVVVKVLYKSLWVLTTPLWGRWVVLSPFSRRGNWGREVKWLAQGCTGSWTHVWWPSSGLPCRGVTQMNSQGSAGVSQTIQAQFPCLSPALTIPDLLKRCLEPSRSWAGSAILRQRVQELHGELDTHTQRVLRQLQLCFGASSLLPQLRVNPEPNTGAAPTWDLSQTFHLLLFVAKNPLHIPPRSRYLQHGSFHSLSFSLSLSEFVSLHRIKLPPFPAPQHQHFNSTRAIHVSRKVSMHASITYRTSRVLGDDTKHRGDHRTAHV